MTVFDEWQSIFTELLKRGSQQLKPEIVPEELAEQLLTCIEGTLLMSRLYDHGDERHRLRRGFHYIRQLLKEACVEG